jgi:hypothetical protein
MAAEANAWEVEWRELAAPRRYTARGAGARRAPNSFTRRTSLIATGWELDKFLE